MPSLHFLHDKGYIQGVKYQLSLIDVSPFNYFNGMVKQFLDGVFSFLSIPHVTTFFVCVRAFN